MGSSAASSTYKSPYFRLTEVSEGVYAALAIEGTGSWANAGIVDLGDQTLVFDTFATPEAALDLRSAAEDVTGRLPSYVLNSHSHVDHYHGNQVFTGATIISTAITRDIILNRYPRFAAMVKAHHEEQVTEIEGEMKAEKNPLKLRELGNLLGEFNAIYRNIGDARLTLPSITFEDRVVLHGSSRSVEFITYGGGHSGSDAFLYLPKERIAFLADLMHIGYHGEFSSGNPDEWIQALSQIEQLDIDTVISGHGGIGTAQHILQMKSYLTDLKTYAEEWILQGGTLETTDQAAIPEQYAALEAPSVFHRNLNYLVKSFTMQVSQ